MILLFASNSSVKTQNAVVAEQKLFFDSFDGSTTIFFFFFLSALNEKNFRRDVTRVFSAANTNKFKNNNPNLMFISIIY